MSDLRIANTIAQQIGGKAFFLMGTRQKIGTSNSLIFDIRGSKKANKIEITLEPSDTYRIDFYKNKRVKKFFPPESIRVHTSDDIYFDMLHEVIERNTGLYLSL